MPKDESVNSAKAMTNSHILLTTGETSHQPMEQQQQGFSHFIAVCFTVNYLIGTGFLTIPWAFERGGIVLSLLTLIVVALISNITKNYLLSAMALAEALTTSRRLESESSASLSAVSMSPRYENGYGSANEGDHSMESDTRSGVQLQGLKADKEEYNGNPSTGDDDEDGDDDDDGTPLSLDERDNHNAMTHNIEQQEELAIVRERKFEVIDLCRMYFGEIGEKALIFSVALDVYFELWAFVSVFASSSAREMPLAKNFGRDYYLYACIFAAIVVPMSCLELREQVQFQITLSACRILVILIMIATASAAVRSDMKGDNKVYFTDVNGVQGAPLFHFGGFGAMFSVTFYATQFHLSIPVVSQAVRDKRQLCSIFRDALLIVTVALSLLGIAVASYFGFLVEESANLNWSTFVGGIQVETEQVPLWARVISLFVLCFPALNVLSAYPINAILLGNNLMAITYGTNDTVHRVSSCFNSISNFLFTWHY